mgnify:CR=1 FL=1
MNNLIFYRPKKRNLIKSLYIKNCVIYVKLCIQVHINNTIFLLKNYCWRCVKNKKEKERY